MAALSFIPAGVIGGCPPSWCLHNRLLGFVKTVLIRQLVEPGAVVCDLFCGRNLDADKWAEAKIARYIGVDLSASALEGAREEWEQKEKPFPADFCELDPCMLNLRNQIQEYGMPADVVCCFAHLPDCFTSEEMVRSLLRNISSVLRPGGYFFGSAPDSSTIWYKYQKAVEDAMRAGALRFQGALPSIRTDLYKISFDDDRFHRFGSKFFLRFSDDGFPAQSQTLIHFPSLLRLAEEFDLECVEVRNLQEFYEDSYGPFGDVLRSSCGSLVDQEGNPIMDFKGRLNAQSVDVLSLYTTIIFRKLVQNSEPCTGTEPILKEPAPEPRLSVYTRRVPLQHTHSNTKERIAGNGKLDDHEIPQEGPDRGNENSLEDEHPSFLRTVTNGRKLSNGKPDEGDQLQQSDCHTTVTNGQTNYDEKPDEGEPSEQTDCRNTPTNDDENSDEKKPDEGEPSEQTDCRPDPTPTNDDENSDEKKPDEGQPSEQTDCANTVMNCHANSDGKEGHTSQEIDCLSTVCNGHTKSDGRPDEGNQGNNSSSSDDSMDPIHRTVLDNYNARCDQTGAPREQTAG
ncbi:hypothetical protein R1sor_013190 [Riccia sorocarpa]|uniref:mRNA (guanine-N(7))-methyltransferase n=1 Tax=Riccia sorocarpa TaxID=122646 RepID=A0ABD3H7T9_9MARC